MERDLRGALARPRFGANNRWAAVYGIGCGEGCDCSANPSEKMKIAIAIRMITNATQTFGSR